ncbi:MAG: virulence factor SrfB, partial [Prevotellaceae bacterium]|nr:virulence factor SrfB [Prevotellaceae bacterium]
LNTEERNEWIYDEATCAQFVYLYAELTKRYRNNCKEYFDFYGKIRKDLGDYSKKSLTVGSVDIGAGTTDVMIAAYKYDDAGQCTLTPVPLFWESFYVAGDDLLKDLIRKLVIEGTYAAIQKQLEESGRGDIARLILDFFDLDNARQDVERRRIRSEFNLQVSVPVVSHFLELLNENKIEKATLSFDDIFANNPPTDRVLNYFANYFGFSVKDLQWHYDKEIVSKIVVSTFDTLAGKISVVLSSYGCDIVLLSGRPTSLKPLSDLFLKYYAVSPNRLITLNSYRIGTWYPFQNGEGYFKDTKSIVAVGAMIGYYAATRGSLEGFSLDLSELIKEMLPTTEYFAKAEKEEPFITPEMKNATIKVSQFPLRIWTRQFNPSSYPTRPFYILDFNKDKIKERMKNKLCLEDDDKQATATATNNELERLLKLSPFKFGIVRESYPEDKETLKIGSVTDRNGEELPEAYFSLQVQSMSESESYWLDSGEFTNLNINH